MTIRRPDQWVPPQQGFAPGSRSGSIESAQALAYPGVPPGVPKLLGASQKRVGPSISNILTFPEPGRLWFLTITFFLSTNNTYPAGVTAQTFVDINAIVSGLLLGAVELGASAPEQGFGGQSDVQLNGMPVQANEKIQMSVNNGVMIFGLFQRATCSVLYSIP